MRVNDRGPFIGDRVIDVSRRAAQLLGFYGKGLTEVRVEYLGLDHLEPDVPWPVDSPKIARVEGTPAPAVAFKPRRPQQPAAVVEAEDAGCGGIDGGPVASHQAGARCGRASAPCGGPARGPQQKHIEEPPPDRGCGPRRARTPPIAWATRCGRSARSRWSLSGVAIAWSTRSASGRSRRTTRRRSSWPSSRAPGTRSRTSSQRDTADPSQMRRVRCHASLVIKGSS